MLIQHIVMVDASKGKSRTLRTKDGGGSRALPTLRFSVEDMNGEFPRSAGRGGSGSRAPRLMENVNLGCTAQYFFIFGKNPISINLNFRPDYFDI